MRNILIPGISDHVTSLQYYIKQPEYIYNSKAVITDPYTRFYTNYKQQRKEIKAIVLFVTGISFFSAIMGQIAIGIAIIAIAEYKYSLFSIHNNMNKLSFVNFVQRYQSDIKNATTLLFYRYNSMTYFLKDKVTEIVKKKSKEKFECTFPLIQFINSIYATDFEVFDYSVF